METANNKTTTTKSGSQFNDMLNKSGLQELPHKIQQFGSTTFDKVNNLSTTQKVVGGTLLALGAGWVTMNSMKGKNILGQKKMHRTS
ncbi:hypothetical protein [Botryobacter ruber]|uniref:hypothetical protein n=1 Tax=Botryobacter ruber TaxID=2171629 RepID=UPI000E0C4113|nr:hypothetical protein [Botryobacter ruber]